MIATPQTQFFNFRNEVEYGPDGVPKIKFQCYMGVSWVDIERYYTETDGKLTLVLKSTTEGYKNEWVQEHENKKPILKAIKGPRNIITQVDRPEDVERFFKAIEVVREIESTPEVAAQNG